MKLRYLLILLVFLLISCGKEYNFSENNIEAPANVANTIEYFGQIVETIDPCGDDPLNVDEVIFILEDGSIISYIATRAPRSKYILGNGIYTTLDTQKCKFEIFNGEYKEL